MDQQTTTPYRARHFSIFNRNYFDSKHYLLNPTVPSTLMQVVWPYLSFEEACKCKQLNSSFNQYIGDSWKYMKKKKDIRLVLHVFEKAAYGECVQIEYCACPQHVFEGFQHYDSMYINIFPSFIMCVVPADTWTSGWTSCAFIKGYLENRLEIIDKESEKKFGKINYKINNRSEGIAIVLEAFTTRCAIVEFMQDCRWGELSQNDWETIQKSMSNCYVPNWGDVKFVSLFRKYNPIILEMAKAFGRQTPRLVQCIENEPIDYTSLQWHNLNINLQGEDWEPKEAAKLIEKQHPLMYLLKVWRSTKKRITNFMISAVTKCEKRLQERWTLNFAQLETLLNLDHSEEITVETTKQRSFEINRAGNNDVLRVLLSTYGFNQANVEFSEIQSCNCLKLC